MALSNPNGLWSPDTEDIVAPLENHLAQMQQSVDDLAVDIQSDIADVDARKVEPVHEIILTSAASTVILHTQSGFSTFRISILARSDATGVDRQAIRMRFNGDSGNVYDSIRTINDDGTLTTVKAMADQWIFVGRVPAVGSGISTNNMGAVGLTFPHARGLTNFKACLTSWGGRMDSGVIDQGTGWGQRRSTEVVTQIRFDLPGGANFISGSRFTLEGVPTS